MKLPQGALVITRDLFSVRDKVKYGWKRWLTDADRATSAFREACLEHRRLPWLQACLDKLDRPVQQASPLDEPTGPSGGTAVASAIQYPHLSEAERQDMYRWALLYRDMDALHWLFDRYPYDVLQGDTLLPVVSLDPRLFNTLWRQQPHRLHWAELSTHIKGPAALDWVLQLDVDAVAKLNASGDIGREAACVGHLKVLRHLRTFRLGHFSNLNAYDAAAHGHLEVVEWLLDDAEVNGHREVVQWLLACGRGRQACWSLALSGAALHGCLDIVQWLLEHVPVDWNHADAQITFDDAICAAARIGHLEIVQRLYSAYSAYGKMPARDGRHHNNHRLEFAACRGHLDVVRYICGQEPHLNTDGAMKQAAANGHLDIVQFLYDNKPLGTPPPTMLWTITSVHLHVYRWLHERQIAGCTTDAMNWAAYHGRLDAVQWLHENRTEGCTTDAMDRAAANGRLEVVQWLHQHRREGCTAAAMNRAAAGGYLDVVQFLHGHRTEGCTAWAMDMAAAHGHLEVVQWLHTNRTEGCTTAAMDRAADNGHLEVVRWLHENRTEGCTTMAMQMAATNGHLEVVQFLQKRPDVASRILMSLGANPLSIVDIVVMHLDMVMWWYRHRTERCTPNGLETLRLQWGRKRPLAVINWLTLYGGVGDLTGALENVR